MTKLASTWNARIHVPARVASMPFVQSLTTFPRADAQKDIPEIHLPFVHCCQWHVSVTSLFSIAYPQILYSACDSKSLIPVLSVHQLCFAATPSPVEDPCVPSPCGPNAECFNGVCNCVPEFRGDPYVGCRPECVLNDDCPRDRACIRNKCMDPCPGACAINALCTVINHVPMCSCPGNMTGNAFSQCTPLLGISCVIDL